MCTFHNQLKNFFYLKTLTDYLLFGRYCLKSSANIDSFSLVTGRWKKIHGMTLHMQTLLKAERRSDWPKDTQRIGSRAKIWTHAVWCAESTLQTTASHTNTASGQRHQYKYLQSKGARLLRVATLLSAFRDDPPESDGHHPLVFYFCWGQRVL